LRGAARGRFPLIEVDAAMPSKPTADCSAFPLVNPRPARNSQPVQCGLHASRRMGVRMALAALAAAALLSGCGVFCGGAAASGGAYAGGCGTSVHF
jgi:hypothetical protein